MDIQDAEIMVKIGARLKVERNRLKLRQFELARLVGVTNRTQCKYEFGQQEIRAKYLAKLAELGVDIHYLITGIPNQVLLEKKEYRLLEKYRKATPEVRKLLELGLELEEDA
ncbi:hypothetical protein A1D23_13020 [Chelonobacter oris]|uniref:helix-turn-helix domain-containing protein n=1 Tax=Chelonobacter oris TaxID=505317 RepID=UPI00244B2A0A|nr:helix-turn-helix transcriptional regulator [Chelonobacter oris]MDH3001461.1 hypothetical protein [Chelonobacter oris]